jgi:predicted PurR-regulated permease PerM
LSGCDLKDRSRMCKKVRIMKEDDQFEEPREEPSDNRLILISLGALIGGAVSVILLRSDRIIMAFRQKRLQLQMGVEGESNEREDASLETGLAPAAPEASLPGVQAQGKSSKPNQPTVPVVNPQAGPAGNRWSTPTRYIMGVLLFLAGVFVLFIGRSVIPMVILAALVALFVNPLIQFFRRRLRMKIGLAVGITYFFVVAVLLLAPLLLIPALVDAVNFVLNIDAKLVAEQLSQAADAISTALQAIPGLGALLIPILDSLVTILNNFASPAQSGASGITLSAAELTSQFGKALGIAAGVLGPTFTALASIVFTFLMSLQMTLTAGEMKNWSADLIPPKYSPELRVLMMNIRQSWIGFLRGQMSLMLIIGILTWLGATILGLPQALLLGVIAGVLELIPNVGPTLAAIPAVLLALFFGSTHLPINNLIFALLVVGFYVVVQLVENQLIVPRVMGNAVDLPTLVVLIGTIAGAGAFGILGALLATPFIATGNLVFRYVYRKIMEEEPTPPPVEEPPGFLDTVKGFFSRLRKSFSRRAQPTPAQPKGATQPTQKKG